MQIFTSFHDLAAGQSCGSSDMTTFNAKFSITHGDKVLETFELPGKFGTIGPQLEAEKRAEKFLKSSGLQFVTLEEYDDYGRLIDEHDYVIEE